LGWRASTPLSDGVFSVYHELCDLSNASR